MRNYLIIIGIFLLLACNEQKQAYKVFHYNQVNVIQSLDPAFAKSLTNIWPVNHIFNTLVDLNDSLNVEPSIASSWKIYDEGKRYEFTIKKNIQFHPDPSFGDAKYRSLRADDVVYSLNRIIDPKVNSPGSWIFKDRVIADQPFKVVNDTVVSIELIQAFRPFLGLLSMKYCSVVPKEAVEYYGSEFRKHPVGTGPLKFKRWVENKGLYLVRHEDYFKGAISYDGVKTSFIGDKKIAFLELLNGNLDFISGLESSFIDEMLNADGTLRTEHENKLSFHKAPYLNTEYIGINLNALDPNSALQEVDFRKALNYAIDREQLLLLLRNNVGQAANSGFIPKGLPSFIDSTGYPYDLGKAKYHLALSSYDFDNKEVIEIKTNQDYLDIITFVARQWELLGIKVNIEVLESSVLRAGMRSGEIGLFRASWIADYPDEENFLSLFYSKNPAPPNYTRFANVKLDNLYQKALAENDDLKRNNLYQSMDKIIIEQCPVIFLFYDETALFYNSRIKDPSINGINQLNVAQLSVD